MTLERAKSIEIGLQTITEDDALEERKERKTFLEKIYIIFSNITLEPVFALYMLPCAMSSLAIQNLNLEKACRVNLELNNEICDGLTDRNSSLYNETDEVVVQKLVASMYAWKNVVQSLVPAALLLFWGSWSDRNQRRKPCILLPIFGEAISSVCFLICTYFFYQISVEFSILSESLPPALTGGWFTMYMGVYSYISAISSVETRTVRIGAISTFNNVSYTLGIALSGVLYAAIGFYGVFSLSLAMFTTGIVYGYVRIKDAPLTESQSQAQKKRGFLKDFFDYKHVRETFKVAFKDGPKNRKKRICIIMVLVMVIVGPLHGEYTVMYLFVRYRFNWSEIEFSIFATYSAIVYTLGTIFSLAFFSRFLKMDDALLGVISSLSKVLSAIVYAFAPTPTIFYLASIIEMLNGTSFIAMRSIMSKLVPRTSSVQTIIQQIVFNFYLPQLILGKINSLFGVSEALMPLLYGPLYSMVYKWTINIAPGAFFLFGGILTLPAVFIFLWLYGEHKRDLKEAKAIAIQSDKLLSEGEGV